MTADRIVRRFLGVAKDVPKAIGLDFDGVLHSYTSPWTTATEIPDPPVPGALEAVKSWIKAGYEVVITSARADDPGGKEAIEAWLKKHGFPALPVHPKLKATIYIDDRGFRFEGKFPTADEIEKLRPWTKPSR